MKNLILTIIFAFIIWALIEVVKVQSMSDKNRKKYGHGPKGQGK
ncbi:hypothetical protein [uncultured Sphaerochaeta sp.]|nr:hypothetical protein [uncultured Sphaerochaeta sp.]